MKIFNGRSFFSVFFIARANQKIQSMALGRGSRTKSTGQRIRSCVLSVARNGIRGSFTKQSVGSWVVFVITVHVMIG
jgi:hypothetical protein